jgi:hypothetical protein
MSQPQQIIFVTPNNDQIVIDNAPSPSFPTLTQGTGIGYDTKTGAVAQGSNTFANTGTTTLDTSNDTVWADPQISTFPGNPISQVAPSFKTVTTVLNQSLTGIRVLFKNPAILLF